MTIRHIRKISESFRKIKRPISKTWKRRNKKRNQDLIRTERKRHKKKKI
jgi:hypothetical protein